MSDPALHEASFAQTGQAQPEIPDLERWLAATLLGIGVFLRFLYLWHFRIDSDEPQHLHVVWAWTQGLLPYRDVFDNHSPLFQALYAPLFHLLGQRADIVLPMRAGELPIWALTIFCAWKIAGTLYSPRTALWTAVLTALCPPFYFNSIEFRPDQLWTLVWVGILLVLSTGRITPARTFLAGLLCGLAFSVSMKTTLLLLTLGQSLIGALCVRWAAGGLPLKWSKLSRCAAAGLIGIPLIPSLVVLYFVLHGAGPDMKYCVIVHNILPSSTAHATGALALGRWSLYALGGVASGWLMTRLPLPISVRTRLGFLFFAGYLYYATLVCFWPVITAEDFLPFYPAAMLSAGPAALWLADFALRQWRFFAGPVLAGAELIGVLVMASPFQDQTADKIGMVADTLKLTSPEDFVMDSKGETIYRNRPSRYILESMTKHRILLDMAPDDIATDLIAKRVPLATTRRMPQNARDFIKSNYLPIAFRLSALGKVVRVGGDRSNKPRNFTVAVPQRYTLLTPSGPPTGALDGTPFTGPRELEAGTHTFIPEVAHGDLVLIWAAAVERGYSPFAPIKKDYMTPQD